MGVLFTKPRRLYENKGVPSRMVNLLSVASRRYKVSSGEKKTDIQTAMNMISTAISVYDKDERASQRLFNDAKRIYTNVTKEK